MLSEILKVIPKLDAAAMAAMDRNLSGRFGKIAKKFGGGLKSALMGGGATGFVLAIVNKILNPLEEVQKAINETLNQADDLDTYAKQFHTTPGQLMNLQSLAKAQGVDPEALRTLMGKFQDKVTEARADSEAPSSVRAFVNDTDMAAAFFEFIQSLEKMSDAQKDFVHNDVFGGKQTLKNSEMLNTTTKQWKEIADQLELKRGALLDPAIENGAKAEGFQRILQTKRENEAFLARTGAIKAGMLNGEDQRERLREGQTTRNISGYEGLKTLQMTGDKLQGSLEEGVLLLTKHLPAIAKALGSLAGSRPARGVTGKKGDN